MYTWPHGPLQVLYFLNRSDFSINAALFHSLLTGVPNAIMVHQSLLISSSMPPFACVDMLDKYSHICTEMGMHPAIFSK